MKIKILGVLIIVSFLLLAGCTEEGNDEEEPTGDDGSQDNNDDISEPAGWYLKEIVDYGDPDTSSSASQYGIQYSRGNVTTNHYSADGVYELTVRTLWEAPPDYLAEEEEFSVEVTKEALVLELQLLGYYDTTTIAIDNYTLEPGSASISIYYLSDDTVGQTLSLGQGATPDTIKTAIFNGTAPKANDIYKDQFGLIITIKNGPTYGIKYVYEWRE